MEFIHQYMYHIDFEDRNIINVPIDGQDALEFIDNVINETLTNNSTKKYLKKSDTTEVIGLVKRMIVNDSYNNQACISDESAVAVASVDDNEKTQRIAERLMESEIEAQLSIESTGIRLRKGSLIQALINEDDSYRYVLIKIDHSSYLDIKNLSKNIGLPLEEKILKSCVIDYDENNEIRDINLNDSSRKIANYWWNGLLELKPANKDDYNTKNAFRRIHTLINKEVTKFSPSDATMLINRSKGYFDSKTQFDIDDYVNTVIEEYLPKESIEFNNKKAELKRNIKNLATKYFDGQFSIDVDVINKVKPDMYKIDDNIYLTLKGEIETLKDKIISEKKDGKWILKISDVPEDIGEKFEF